MKIFHFLQNFEAINKENKPKKVYSQKTRISQRIIQIQVVKSFNYALK